MKILNRIQVEVEKNPAISRRALSRTVCTWLDWRGANGKLKDMGCRKALAELERREMIDLPATENVYAFQRKPRKSSRALSQFAEINCQLGELGAVDIVPVTSRYSKASRVWKDMMNEHHYLGAGPLCGAQVRYLIQSKKYGWLGGLSFSAATWRLKDRDRWIGWSEAARRKNLQRVVCNSRFLIVPSVRVANLASQVLSRCAARLANDWRERYGYEPVLLETFVDPARFRGTCYRAANWIYIGETAGRNTPYPNGKVPAGKKTIFVYPLCHNWQAILCAAPERPLGSKPRPENPMGWVEEEFGTVEFYDERLKQRLFMLADDFSARPGDLVPQACGGSKARIKAAYRFLKNERVTMKTLLKPHVEASLERIRKHDIVLAVQDTSQLNYSAHPTTKGLGPINTTHDNSIGLVLHDTLAFTVEGTPLGVLDAQCWARNPKEAGKRHLRHKLPIQQKESFKWLKSYHAVAEVQALCPDTMLVSVGDREADIYEFFQEALQKPAGPKLLVRADRGRQRKVDTLYLWEKLLSEPVTGYRNIFVPRRGSRPKRTARLSIHFAQVTLSPPKTKPKLSPVTVWAVYAYEIDYAPTVKSPLDWMLLTTVEVSNFEDAVERLDWYTRRWGIEVYHRTLKSGCRIEDRQLGTADSIEACLAIDLVIAWRVYWLTKQSRETPDVSCEVFLSEDEWKPLYAYIKKEHPPEKPPTLREAAHMVAMLGGFVGSKKYPDPGTTTTWRGLQRVQDIALGFALYRSFFGSTASP